MVIPYGQIKKSKKLRMKTIQQIQCIMMVIALTIILTSCQKEKHAPQNDQPLRLEANLVMDKNLFTASNRERYATDAFEIIEVKRLNDVLEVKVKGGGTAESFQFIWDGSILLSYPGSIQLLLKYDNSKQDFDLTKELVLSVNLQKILGTKHKAGDFYFNVINGSKLQTVTLDPNGTSTKENK